MQALVSRTPGASTVIDGGLDASGIAFDDVAHALQISNNELRLFGKPESYLRAAWSLPAPPASTKRALVRNKLRRASCR